ncbi:acetyl/propionyl/methylcrotonyl-CoA carboxylase subunit alpha [Leeia oryzae]|uniref:acetyl/propionyl/methylcrotonyl-CoA carboxylase subunit alpha n=1 Tax=Leeia oryzae TaxID=356662 RepID=UPI00036A81E0|nr:acetyl/propionyl/methylcrotonyl-CoA carboxylase subunit alpha [Leeia oryzae]
MFQKILIANRGEIACRVIKTAKRMGIQTVAVYSTADANSLHVRLADEAVWIGEAAVQESYLQQARIIDAALATGAEAIHPGYGFLSENAEFARLCEANQLVFIGPPVSAIAAMGSKSAAKALMEAAGVPLTPSYHGNAQEPVLLQQEADRIGYPVLIKASAGGGGKGMRRVDSAAEFAAALTSCKREALSSFGDDQVLIEKYISPARHIEIQVFGDAHGHYVYLFERDCSVQRRHQKVLEEAPAPGMTDARRQAMGQAAVAAAAAVNYTGAGTVEFIVQQDGSFYFMEMNTRLQVEHPVTEMITGLDLVEWQLRVAAGESLPLTQSDLQIHGHAIEARIYAEDPEAGFLPSTGRLHHLHKPAKHPYIRVDTGVTQGDVITPYYDPMIAKLIVWGQDRTQALARMKEALASYQIVGVHHNIAFLHRLVGCSAFESAALSTSLIEQQQAALFPPPADVPDIIWCQAALAIWSKNRQQQHASPWAANDDWRLNSQHQGKVSFSIHTAQQSASATVDVAMQLNKSLLAQCNDSQLNATVHWLSPQQCQIKHLQGGIITSVVVHANTCHVWAGGQHYQLQYQDPLAQHGSSEAEEGGLHAPMPGKIIALLAEAGSHVVKGQPLLVMEAMKMEHTITAPNDGLLDCYFFAEGEQVPADAILVRLHAANPAAPVQEGS